MTTLQGGEGDGACFASIGWGDGARVGRRGGGLGGRGGGADVSAARVKLEGGECSDASACAVRMQVGRGGGRRSCRSRGGRGVTHFAWRRQRVRSDACFGGRQPRAKVERGGGSARTDVSGGWIQQST